jgi:outer membrane receptor protein involved in Fe transport
MLAAQPLKKQVGIMSARTRWCLAAVASLMVSVPVRAAEDEEALLAQAYGDDATISLATGTQQALRRAPAVATVITAGDIAAMGATDLDQVLETVAGLHVNVAPSMRNTLYVIRGVFSLQTPQVLVLQNGLPITVMLSGGRGNLSGGPAVENIARIEIIRGPGSALYGADAFSGVINIITRGAGETEGTRFGARAGSFGSRDAWVQHGGGAADWSWAAFAKLASNDGFRSTIESDAQTRNDRAFGTRASLAPGMPNAGGDSTDAGLELARGGWRWRSLYKRRSDIGTYAGLGSALDPVGRGSSERLTSDLGWTSPASHGDWQVGAGAAWMLYQQRYPVPAQIFPPGTRLPTGTFVDGMFGAPEISERSVRLQAHATYSGWAGHRVRLGAGHDDLHLYMARDINNFRYSAAGVPIPTGTPVAQTPLPFIYPQRRRVDYAYLQDEWRLHPDWTLTAGLRHDRYSDVRAATNPRLALVWDAAADWTLKLLYGEAFRAPTFAELYSTNNPIARGNTALKPETTRTFEAVSNWTATPNLTLNVSVYGYRMRDIVRTVPNPPPAPGGTTYTNVGRQHARGAEIEAQWDATRQLRLSGHLSLVRAIDPATGADVGNVPRRDAFVRADWRLANGWRFDAMLNHVADRRRAPGDARPPVPDYTTLDLAVASAPLAGGWTFSAALRNAFDADVREPNLAPGLIANDLPQAGRSFMLQAGCAF